MRREGRLPADQAEVVLSDVLVEQLGDLASGEREDVLTEIAALCERPSGRHPLRTPLAGWNTLDVLGGRSRVMYRAAAPGGVGLIEALCVGPRSDNEVYDMAVALAESGLLTENEISSIWDALAVLDVIEEDVGLDGWDYVPPPAPQGMRRAAVASGLLSEEQAALLCKPELEAAMEQGWGPGGPDPIAALTAALERARLRSRRPRGAVPVAEVLASRSQPRCGEILPRAQVPCVRRRGHPGPHRARP